MHVSLLPLKMLKNDSKWIKLVQIGEVGENGRGDNYKIEMLTNIGGMENRVGCRLGSAGNKPWAEAECAECLLVRPLKINTCGREG